MFFFKNGIEPCSRQIKVPQRGLVGIPKHGDVCRMGWVQGARRRSQEWRPSSVGRNAAARLDHRYSPNHKWVGLPRSFWQYRIASELGQEDSHLSHHAFPKVTKAVPSFKGLECSCYFRVSMRHWWWTGGETRSTLCLSSGYIQRVFNFQVEPFIVLYRLVSASYCCPNTYHTLSGLMCYLISYSAGDWKSDMGLVRQAEVTPWQGA